MSAEDRAFFDERCEELISASKLSDVNLAHYSLQLLRKRGMLHLMGSRYIDLAFWACSNVKDSRADVVAEDLYDIMMISKDTCAVPLVVFERAMKICANRQNLQFALRLEQDINTFKYDLTEPFLASLIDVLCQFNGSGRYLGKIEGYYNQYKEISAKNNFKKSIRLVFGKMAQMYCDLGEGENARTVLREMIEARFVPWERLCDSLMVSAIREGNG